MEPEWLGCWAPLPGQIVSATSGWCIACQRWQVLVVLGMRLLFDMPWVPPHAVDAMLGSSIEAASGTRRGWQGSGSA